MTLKDVYDEYRYMQKGYARGGSPYDKMLEAIYFKVEGNEVMYEKLFNEIFDHVRQKNNKWVDESTKEQWIQEYKAYKTHFEASNLEEQIRKDLAVGHSPEYLALLEKRKHPIRKFFDKIFK